MTTAAEREARSSPTPEDRIGAAARARPSTRRLALAGALALAGLDLGVAALGDGRRIGLRLAIATPFLLLALVLNRGRLELLGLRLSPARGWMPWVGWGLAAAVLIGLVSLPAVWLAPDEVDRLALYGAHRWRGDVLADIVRVSVKWPLVEETIHRLGIAVLFASAMKGNLRPTILTGACFSLLHVLYGNPSPDNLVAGFVLTWVFLESRSILIPLGYHAAGNLGVLVIQGISAHLHGYL